MKIANKICVSFPITAIVLTFLCVFAAYATNKKHLINSIYLDYKTDITTRNERGQLSRAFNQMTGDVKKTTTSIDYFNKEIAERREAEEELKNAAIYIDAMGDAPVEMNTQMEISNLNRASMELKL